MSASEAFHYDETLLMKDPVTILLLAERKCCPSLRDVNDLYEKWTIATKGPSNEDVMFDHLEEFINNYHNANDMQIGKWFLQRYHKDNSKEEPLIISICTPMMTRVHTLRQAGEMAFMDASHHPSGAQPLAV